MFESIPALFYQGNFLALSSALVWASAVILFRISGRTVSPIGLNLFKSLLAGIFIVLTMLILNEPFFPDVPGKHYVIFILSGIIGIGISDTLMFACLNRLGAGLTAIVDCSYSPSVILLATIFLGETLSLIQLLGVAMIVLAVLFISPKKQKIPLPGKVLMLGIIFGITAMFTMAVSIILMKPLLHESNILWATMFRSIGGIVFISGMLLINPKRLKIIKEMISLRNWKPMIPGSTVAYLSLWLWMGGMKYTQASEASALNQMTAVFIFVFGIIFLKERATLMNVFALMLATFGILLVTLF